MSLPPLGKNGRHTTYGFNNIPVGGEQFYPTDTPTRVQKAMAQWARRYGNVQLISRSTEGGVTVYRLK